MKRGGITLLIHRRLLWLRIGIGSFLKLSNQSDSCIARPCQCCGRYAAGALLRDGNSEMRSVVVTLLENWNRMPDAPVCTWLINSLLRRRVFAGVRSAAVNVPGEAVTLKMRALLAAVAAHQGHLDEALLM
jgi:hypothetical protein